MLILHENKPEEAENELNRFLAIIIDSKDRLTMYGYEEFTFESFFDVLVTIIQDLFTHTRDSLLAAFQAGGEADYYTWYMRLLTALGLRENPERFFPFIEDLTCADMDTYVKREVEPMGRECEQIHIIVISELLGVLVVIEYLDGQELRDGNSLSQVECGVAQDSLHKVTLLYRPGHYDILYV